MAKARTPCLERTFPLIKLAKKLKGCQQARGEWLGYVSFPLIKLAKKLKDLWLECRPITGRKVSIN